MSKVRSIKRPFIDSLRIYVRGGAGGHGLPKFGGVGGKGGDVYLEATKFTGLNAFLHAYPNRNISALNGEDSKRTKIVGTSGSDKIVEVPVGVAVYDEKNKIGELNEVGERLLVAAGGPGGSPKTIPPYNGAKGQERLITLDLKLIADVGLVGFPNAGKSTLLKAISRANPKIASYAFTTLRPNLGVLEYPDLRQISMADLPGLIEGAANNVGMGHSFLKHVERTSMILMVVDVDGFQYRPDLPHRNCLETVVLLNKELELYDKALLRKPAILAVNKMDLPNSSEKLKEITRHVKALKNFVADHIPEDLRPEKLMKFKEIVPISARFDKKSVAELKNTLRRVLDDEHMKALNKSAKAKETELVAEIKRANREVGTPYI